MWLGDLDGAAAIGRAGQVRGGRGRGPPDHQYRHGPRSPWSRNSAGSSGGAPDQRRGAAGWPTRARAGRDTAIRSTWHPGHILIELDRLDEARSTLDTGRRISEELGVRWHLPSYQGVRGVERFIAGEWDDAIAELEAGLDLADETGETYSLRLRPRRAVADLLSPRRPTAALSRPPPAPPRASCPPPAPATAPTGRCGRAPSSWRPAAS